MKTLKYIYNNIFQLIFIVFILSATNLTAQSNCDNEVLGFDLNSDQVILNSALTGNADFTVEFWFKPNPNEQLALRKYFKWVGANNYEPFSITQVVDELRVVDRYFDGGQDWIRPFIGVNVRDGIWHHFAMTKNGNDITLFLDDLMYSYVTNVTSTFDLPNTIKLGRTSEVVSASLTGSMDEVRIWNFARSQSQITNNRGTELVGNETGLVTYYKFSEGVPNQDNSAITEVCDWSGNGYNGSLVSFTMDGNVSNFITNDLQINVLEDTCNDLPCGPILPTECFVNTINISTGVNHANNQLYPIGQQTGYWTLVNMPPPPSAPTSNISLPYSPFSISPNGAWGNFPTSTWISAFNSNNLDENNRPPLPPYSYETYFCVSEDNSDVLFDFQALADDEVTVLLTDTQGNALHTFGEANYKQSTALDVNESINLDAGTYCIRGDVRNTNAVAMGFNLEGTISGATFIDYGCCDGDGSVITGQKFHDKNCDGEYSDYELSMGLAGWEIQLRDPSNGQVLETQFTDDLGFYYFRNLSAGSYAISEVNQPNWERTLPNNNYYQVTLGTFVVQGGYHFGNKYEGPIETEDLQDLCVGPNTPVHINWIGQDCDCDIDIIAMQCQGLEPDILLSTISNTGSYTVSPGALNGEYNFMIRDCDGNEIPVNGCMRFSDYSASISYKQVGCGEYEFGIIPIGGYALIDIHTLEWEFDAIGNSTNTSETVTFETGGTYHIRLDMTLTNGCVVTDYLQLVVEQGADDPNCNFCPPNVLSEIEQGDLYIYDECFGMIIKSPNGSCYRIKVSDAGLLYAQGIECP